MSEHLENDSGKIQLTFAQVAWFISVLVAILLTWGDLSSRLARIEERQSGNSARITALENRNASIGFTKDDAEELRKEILKEIRNR